MDKPKRLYCCVREPQLKIRRGHHVLITHVEAKSAAEAKRIAEPTLKADKHDYRAISAHAVNLETGQVIYA